MNKHDFYKELMSEYSFDMDEIKNNAKKGRFARSKISPLAIGLTSAVAAATVICGTVAVNMVGGKGGVDLVDSGSTLSNRTAEQRVLDAIEKQKAEQNNEEIVDVLVTFNTPVSPDSAEGILSAHSESSIPVTAVYLANGTKITGSANIADVFSGSDEISAVAVRCAGSVMSKLQSDSNVFLVELMSESDFDTVVPIKPDEVETIEVQFPDDTGEAVVVTKPSVPDETREPQEDIGGVVVIPTEEVDEDVGTTESVDNAVTTETTEYTETAETVDSNETVDIETTDITVEATTEPTVEAETNDETVEAPEQSEIVDVPVTPVLPEGVTLPVNPEKFSYSTDNIDAVAAFFLRNDIMYVRTETAIQLYLFDGYNSELRQSMDCTDAKIHWVSENGGKMIVSGVDENGIRNKLFLVNADDENIYNLNAEDVVMSGVLADAAYNAESKKLVYNIKEDGIYYICISELTDYSGSSEYMDMVFQSAAKTTLVASSGNTVYLAVADGALTQIYAVNIASRESRIIKTYDNSPKISNTLGFVNGIVYPSGSAVAGNIEIFNSDTENFIKTGYFDKTITFGASKRNFSVDGNVYTVADGTITAVGGVNAAAAIDYKKSFSSKYAANALAGYVNITNSIYTDKNRSGLLTFDDVYASGGEKFNEAVNGAIGINNALALSSCSSNGIYTQQRLNKCLEVYYSDSAATKIKSICGISEHGSFKYDGSSLTAINAQDTRLVISADNGSTASGTLYIKAGSFAGKTAYRAVSVSFVMEDNLWKLNSVIG